MDAFVVPTALFLAFVLLAAAAHKVIEAERLATAAARLAGVRPDLGRPLSLAAAGVEITAAIALMMPGTRMLGGLIAVSLWSAYGILLLNARRDGGPMFDCGCGFGSRRSTDARPAPLRAFVLAALALIPAQTRSEIDWGIVDIVVALALFSLYLAANELAALPPPTSSRSR